METKQRNWKNIDKRNPFVVPDDYFDKLTSNIMDNLPEKESQCVPKVTLMDKVRPWLYMAAIFAGLGFFFKILVGTGGSGILSEEQTMGVQIVQVDENSLYWDILEANYADNILIEEIEESE